MRSVEEIRSELCRAADEPAGDLAAAALWIAAEEYPDLDHGAYLGYLDDVAGAIERRIGDRDGASDLLSEEVFVRQGFAGNAVEYYDPRNSYLNEVIDRRRGIPITLAVIYLSVGRRLRMPVHGVNAPGHFLVRHGERVLDPFAGGRDVATATLLEQIRQMGVSDAEQHLQRLLATPPDVRAILVRMLGNLKANYLQRKDFVRSLAVVDRLVQLEPRNPSWLRDRGALYQRLECARAAIADLERYLELAPEDPERDVIRETIIKLSRNAPTLQ
ncbi:tetratricopeptide repeat protein [Candidatus Binatia bacterium]|jgi:regulator of sirC expression with transglutaminase-like and TPR domain|nr:tetratricopeptide repeat protein [Candidatus Binatia bacterium]